MNKLISYYELKNKDFLDINNLSTFACQFMFQLEYKFKIIYI